MNDWIQNIIQDFEQYFYQIYSLYKLFKFCSVCSNNTLYFSDNKALLLIEDEESTLSVKYSKEYIFLYIFSFLTNSLQIHVLFLSLE